MVLAPLQFSGQSLAPNITGGIQRGQQIAQGANILEQQRMALGQQQRQEQERQQQAQAQQQAQQQAASLAERGARGEPIQTGAELARLFVTNPKLAEQVHEAAGIRTEFQKNDLAEFGLRLKTEPDQERQTQMIQQRVANLQAQGRDPKDTAALLNATPERRQQFASMAMMAALSPGERAKIASGTPDSPKIQRSEFIEGEGFAGLTESGKVVFQALPEDLRERMAQAKKQDLMDKLAKVESEPPKLSASLEKRLTASVDAAASAQSSANEMDALASQFEQEKPGGGFFRGKAIEAFKDFTGSQDAISLMRRKYAAIRGSQVIKVLPPGSASDADVALALSGFLDPNANAETIASWLRGVAKLEREAAKLEDFRSAFISAGGSPDRSKRDFEFDGYQINNGDRLNESYRKYRLGKGDSAIVIPDNQRFGNVTEEDIQETLRKNPGMTRGELINRLKEGR